LEEEKKEGKKQEPGSKIGLGLSNITSNYEPIADVPRSLVGNQPRN
jgi:hypothetical protein